MTQGIKDKVFTGASSGLGEAAARHLAQHGAKLCWERGASKGFRRSPKSFRWAMTPPAD
jgi:hypothetical protein